MTAPTRPIRPADLAREVIPLEVAVSRCGEHVCVALRSVRAGSDVVRLALVPFAGGALRGLTEGPHVDTKPLFDPSGRWIAFLSDRAGEANQLFVVARDGGEPLRLTGFARGVTEFCWDPSGRSLVVCAHDDVSPFEVAAGPGATPTARVLRQIDWRDDDTQSLRTHPTHLHVVPFRRDGRLPRARRLTSGPWFATRPRMLDDDRVAYLADPRPDADLSPAAAVFAVPLAGGASERISRDVGAILAFEVDGDELVTLGTGLADPVDADPFRISRDGRSVTADVDRFFAFLCGRGRVAVVHDRGRDVPVTIASDGAIERLVDDDFRPSTWALDGNGGGQVVAAMARGVERCDVYALEAGRSPRRLTRVGGWLRRRVVPRVDEVAIDGPGGPIQTFVYATPGRSEPRATILEIHGGPVWHHTAEPPFGAYVLASAGYRVVCPNIRGSFGFGRAWIEALFGAWGGPDAADCHAVLDWLCAQGLSDPDRLGVTGLSYGGFLTNWLVATSDRFKAAVSENGVANQVSAWAGSDCGATYNRAAGLGDPLTPAGVEHLWAQSPLAHAAAIRTPLLLLQGESDLRCPASDAEQLFIALRVLEREVEYVVYPESFHEYRTYGRPDRRIDRHERQLAWFERFLPAR